MPKPIPSSRLIAAILASGALAGGVAGSAQATTGEAGADRSRPASAALRDVAVFSHPTRITNPWLPLSVHRQSVFIGEANGHGVRSVRTPLTHTKRFSIHGQEVRAAVMESRDYRDGVLDQVTWIYVAQADDGTVYRLGEDTDRFDASGRRVPGGRRATDDRAITIAMPAEPRAGQGIAGERLEPDRVLATNARLTVSRGSFNRVLVVHAPLSSDHPSEVRYYARGVGLIREQGAAGRIELASLR